MSDANVNIRSGRRQTRLLIRSRVSLPAPLYLAVLFALLPAAAWAAERPNIVLILADDFGRELLPVYGGTSYDTPNIDRLSREGLTFTTCYATPLCAPSRVELMTSQYGFRSYTAWGEIDRGADTFVRRLRGAGYLTAMGGKWHLGGWGERPRGVTAAGFERYCSYDYAAVLAASFAGGGNQYWGGAVVRDGEPGRLDRYGPDAFTGFVLDAIRARATDAGAEDRPFFAYLPLDLLHRPFMPTPAHPDAPAPGEPPPADWTGAVGSAEHFPAMLAHADRLVGRVLDTLDELGLADDTLVIFTSDNGTDNVHEAKTVRSDYQGRSVAGGKYFPTELGLNVPLVVRWPGRVEAGRVTDAVADFTDLGVTLCDLAGVAPPAHADGRSLLPVFAGEEPAAKPAVYSWGNFDHSSRRYKEPAKYADRLLDVVRGPRWKLYSDGRLIDLPADRFEQRPVPPGTDPAADAARTTLTRFREQLRRSEPRRW